MQTIKVTGLATSINIFESGRQNQFTAIPAFWPEKLGEALGSAGIVYASAIFAENKSNCRVLTAGVYSLRSLAY